MNLKSQGKDFMKSLIHHTALIGDLKEAQVAILRTPKISGGGRTCELEELTGGPKYTLDQVESMVLETYAIWQLILMTRRTDSAKAADSGSGPLFDN